MKRYIVKNGNGNPTGIPFKSIEDAECYKIMFGIQSWKIELVDIKSDKKSTKWMQKCVKFTEKYSNAVFNEILENYWDCKEYLKFHYKNAVHNAFKSGVNYR